MTLFAAYTFPNPTSYKYVNDYTHTLSQEETNALFGIGQALEQQTGAQAVVVIIHSTDGIPITDYALKLFRTWGIGQKGKDNGLLMLISLNDRTWRVEVGRGLEGAVPDLLSSQFMENSAQPYFREGQYGAGIVTAYTQLVDHIATEYGVTIDYSRLPLPYYTAPIRTTHRSNSLIWILIILLFGDLLLNRGRISSSFFSLLFWSNMGRRGGPKGGSGGGGFGGGNFGGGSSNGGGSSGSW